MALSVFLNGFFAQGATTSRLLTTYFAPWKRSVQALNKANNVIDSWQNSSGLYTFDRSIFFSNFDECG